MKSRSLRSFATFGMTGKLSFRTRFIRVRNLLLSFSEKQKQIPPPLRRVRDDREEGAGLKGGCRARDDKEQSAHTATPRLQCPTLETPPLSGEYPQ